MVAWWHGGAETDNNATQASALSFELGLGVAIILTAQPRLTYENLEPLLGWIAPLEPSSST